MGGSYINIEHYIGGAIAGFLTWFNSTFSIIITFLFVLYELDEEFHLADRSYRDILEYIIGFYIGALIYFAFAILFPFHNFFH